MNKKILLKQLTRQSIVHRKCTKNEHSYKSRTRKNKNKKLWTSVPLNTIAEAH